MDKERDEIDVKELERILGDEKVSFEERVKVAEKLAELTDKKFTHQDNTFICS